MKKLNVVNHTHWDREWYESFETFRGKLVEAVKLILNGLDSGQFEYFMLDGQTVVLEDLKEVLEAEMLEKLESYIMSGKIDIGPWYVLPDEFLVSGESLIRNLKLGMEISKDYGVNEFIGYLPDTFGHIGQLPQIFRGLGISWSLLFRGVNSERKSEVNFIGSDGTKIRSFVLPLWTGYYNHFLSYGDYRERLEKYIKDVEGYSHSDELLLLNGADHLIPWHGLGDRLKELEEELNVQIRQTTLRSYSALFENFDIKDEITGEQRDESKAYILTSVASARTYLKVQNQELEDEITSVAEPMELIKSLVTSEYKYNYLKHIWKTLLKNHPHDSICGCSIDKVHREMETRNMKIRDMIASIEHYASKGLIKSEAVDNKKLYVFNPHPYEVTRVIRTKIVLPLREGFIGLQDNEGKEVPLHILSREKKQVFMADVDLEPNWFESEEYEIIFEAKLKGMGFKEYWISEGKPSPQKIISEHLVENKYLRVWINQNGYLDIMNKESGKLYENANKFISSLDAGDEYTYSPPFEDVISQSRFLGVENILHTGITQQMTLLYELEQPQGLRSDRKGPSDVRVMSLIRTSVKLDRDSRTIEFDTHIDNRGMDHRLRVVFPVMKKVEHYYTDVSFDMVKRTPLENIYYDAEKQREVKVNTAPTDSFLEVPGEFGVLHRGLQECEVTSCSDSGDGAYLTVIRSVGWLSRDDIRTRGGGAGPKFQTPDAQCLGKHSFKYGITFGENTALEAKLMRIQPRVFQGNEITEGLDNILELDNKNLMVSAFYRSSQGNTILRLYNLSEGSESVKITGTWKEIYYGDLRDKRLERVEGELVIDGKKIVTLILQ